MFDLDNGGQRRHKGCADAMKKWRRYLLGQSEDVGMYTQHLFFAFDRKGNMHRRLGGQIFLEEQAVITQMGPLVVAALLGRSHLLAPERAVWGRSKIVKAGGVVKPLDAWRVGNGITMRLAKLLVSIEANIAGKARDIISSRVKPKV
jgi:hypothetical protein